jgi:endoglucanase
MRVRVCVLNTKGAAAGGEEETCGNTNKPSIMDWNIAELIGKNFLFFEAQESGKLKAGHRVSWRGDSYLNDNHAGRSLAGGWFDAGGVGHFLMFQLAPCDS